MTDNTQWTAEARAELARMKQGGESWEVIAAAMRERFALDATADRCRWQWRNRADWRNASEGEGRGTGIIGYLARGRTAEQIATHCRCTVAEAEDIATANYEGYELWTPMNDYGEKCYILLPKNPDHKPPQPRIWTYTTQPDGQPWIWVRFPDDFDVPVIKIFPLADLHEGAKTHNRKAMLNYIEYIRAHAGAFAIGTGDWMENALRDSIGPGVYESQPPRLQIHQLEEDLYPIAHKIIVAQPGNHEDRTYRSSGLCPLEYLCRNLAVPYINDQIHITIFWKGHRWEFFSFHGKTSSRTKGGKLNEAMRPRNFQGHIDFMLMSHVHDSIRNPVGNIVRNYQDFKLEIRESYVVICPSFLGYFGSYASKQAMEPGTQGAVACAIYPDGDYKLDPFGD